MVSKKNLVSLFITSIMMGVSLTGCGNDDSLVATQANYQNGVYSTATQQPILVQPSAQACTCEQIAAAIAKAATDKASGTTTTPATTKATPAPTTPKITPATATTETKVTPKPTATATPAPAAAAAADPEAKGRLILTKIMDKIGNSTAFETHVDKYEKDLNSDKVITQSLTVYGRKPGQVKMDVTAHSNKNTVGAKISYVVGSGKATVRPGGALSFITKEFPQNDDNLVSPNGYTPEQIDFFSMVKRLNKPEYKAVLSGKTTVGGVDAYLLKVTTASNEFDSKIKYEIIGFDPKTFEVKLWETYTDASAEAYMRITIKSFTSLDSLPDSTFKV